MKEKTQNIIIGIITVYFLLMFLFWIFKLIFVYQIFQFAYVSTAGDCLPSLYQEKFSQNYYTAGQTSQNTYANGTTVTEVQIIDNNPTVFKHEHVHVIQFERGWPSLNCSHIGQVYLAELEAYNAQNLPMWLYELLYGNPYNNTV